MSLNTRTASIGAQCTVLRKVRVEYAPIGRKARSMGPRREPISLNAGQTGRLSSISCVSSSTAE